MWSQQSLSLFYQPSKILGLNHPLALTSKWLLETRKDNKKLSDAKDEAVFAL